MNTYIIRNIKKKIEKNWERNVKRGWKIKRGEIAVKGGLKKKGKTKIKGRRKNS